MSSFISAAPVASGQVQSLDSLRGHSLPSDAMIVASATQVNPTNQNTGSYAIVESGVNSLGVTATGSVPATTLSPFADLYKEGSIYFNGTVGNYLQNTATYSNNTINWATSGMTAEVWVNYQSFTGAAYQSSGTMQTPSAFGLMTAGGSAYWALGSNITGYVTFYYFSGSGTNAVMSQTPISLNTWNHVAVSIAPAGSIYLFVNGVQSQVISNRAGTLTGTTNFETVQGTPTTPSTAPLVVGQFYTAYMNGYVADARFTTGAGLYTGSPSGGATFTVPSAPLSSTTSPGVTQFLLRAGSNAPYVSNGALTFDRGVKSYMDFGPQTFNVVTRGFTAIWRGALTGTPGNYERLFQLGLSTTGGIYAVRASTSAAINFILTSTNNTYASGPQNIPITQGVNYVIAFRYNPMTSIADVWVNGVPSGSLTIASSLLVADRTTAYSYLGRSEDASPFLSGSANTFAVYNRALSNVEIYNSYLALNTVPATPQQKTLEIGDINGVPALSVAGNGQVSVQSVGLSSNVVPWPPSALQGYDTVINGGVYKVRSSVEFSSTYLTWYAFDQNSSTSWISSANYSASSPYGYTGTVTTTDVNGTVYPGDWLQIQLPTAIVVSAYTFTGLVGIKFSMVGSRDGTNWTLVDSRSGVPEGTFNGSIPPSQPSTYFRVIINQVNAARYAQVTQWTLYGTADTSPTLTIAPATTFSSSVATPALTGIPGKSLVPQDFSSSGLNIPAYVVSNTATVANTVAYSSFGPFAGEGSLYFPGGTGQYVNFGQPTQLSYNWTSYDFTIEMWVYPVNYSIINQNIFARDYEQVLYYGTDGVIKFYMAGVTTPASGVFIGGTVTRNQWNHLTVSWSQSAQTIYMGLNGAITSIALAAGTPTYTGTRNFVMGTWQGGSTGLNANLSNFRFTRGLALYTTTFTPPTAPLQPIQGTTQAGLPYGTVLLLRNAPAPGRIQTTKFSGANSVGLAGAPQVLSFPPAAMTGYSTALNAGYGQGTYVASASTEQYGPPWGAFDKTIGSGSSGEWQSSSIYLTSSGVYNGTVSTVDVNGTSYLGEWLQIAMPSSITVSNYALQNRSDVNTQMCSKWWIFGSRDGTSWYLVDSRTGVSWSLSQTQTFTVASGQAFTYFRLVTSITNNTSGSTQPVSISEWTLNGSIESVNVTADGRVGLGVVNPTRALEVAGDVVCAGTVSSGNPLMFRNRIINGDFRVDQRGSATSVPTSGYGPDRWQLSSSSSGQSFKRYTLLSASDDVVMKLGYRFGTQINRGTGGLVDLLQWIELGNCSDMFSQPMTLSFWGRASVASDYVVYLGVSSTGTSSVTYSGGVVYYLTTNWQYITLTIPTPVVYSTSTDPSAYGIQITLRAGSGAPNSSVQYYTGVQLEKGSVATPFEVRPYATELALCQRYYEQSYEIGTAPGTNTTVGSTYSFGSSDATNNLALTVKYAVPKRTAITPTYYSLAGTSGVWQYARSGASGTVAPTTLSTSSTSFLSYASLGAAWVVGYVQFHWTASAEL